MKPFGLTNAPSTFQALMNDILVNRLRKFILDFFYDILVYSKSLEDHLSHLEVVLSIMLEQQLFARKEKCSFGLQQIQYLGHAIAAKGVNMDVEKISAATNWPIPKQSNRFVVI